MRPMSTETIQLREQYGDLFETVSAALYASDPLRINTGRNTHAYDPATGTILPRLKDAHSADDVQVLVYEEFCRWFAREPAGDIGRYEEVSAIIWDAWLASRATKLAPE